MRSHPAVLLPVALFFCAACSKPEDLPTAPSVAAAPAESSASAADGSALFKENCAPCHAAGDGGDLAYFNFPDTTIIRRALAHVTLDEAEDIVAHVRTLRPGPLDRHSRPFQPGGRVLSDDEEFALALFGSDQWPDIDSGGLLAIDPRRVPMAVALPLWSEEGENLDWMPDNPLGPETLAFRGAQDALDSYYRFRSDQTLLAAVRLLKRATRSPDANGPCVLADDVAVDPEGCFQAERWIASLGAQHMLRTGRERGFHPSVHDSFWDVGQTVRRTLVRGDVDLGNANQNWAAWMVLGWIFEPGRHASVYIGSGLARLGLPRHATFVALRSMVARPRNSPQPYNDVLNAARFAPRHWAGMATATGLRHLEERLAAGEVPSPPPGMTLSDLEAHVRDAARIAVRKDPAAKQLVGPLAESVLALLPAS